MSPRHLLGVADLVSGAAGLLYQVAWLRHLGLAFGHTHAAISTVLTAFLCGLAVGAALADRRTARAPAAAAPYIGLSRARTRPAPTRGRSAGALRGLAAIVEQQGDHQRAARLRALAG